MKIFYRPESFTPSFEVKPASVRKNMDLYGSEKQYDVNAKKEKTEQNNANLNAAQKKFNGNNI